MWVVSENSRFMFQVDKNKINTTATPYKSPYLTFTTHNTLQAKRFSEVAYSLKWYV